MTTDLGGHLTAKATIYAKAYREEGQQPGDMAVLEAIEWLTNSLWEDHLITNTDHMAVIAITGQATGTKVSTFDYSRS